MPYSVGLIVIFLPSPKLFSWLRLNQYTDAVPRCEMTSIPRLSVLIFAIINSTHPLCCHHSEFEKLVFDLPQSSDLYKGRPRQTRDKAIPV